MVHVGIPALNSLLPGTEWDTASKGSPKVAHVAEMAGWWFQPL